MKRRPEHEPLGDPCMRLRRDGTPCNAPAADHVGHRPEHEADGDPCAKCGHPASAHRGKRPDRHHERTPRPRTARPERRRTPREEVIVAIDGEGQGRAPHRYTYLAAVDERGELVGEVRNRHGLTSKQCLDFVLGVMTKTPEGRDVPVRKLFGFSLGYDLTKWLEDFADETIYSLNRPDDRIIELRDGRTVHRAVFARDYLLNYVRGKFTARKAFWDFELNRPFGVGHTVTVWDVFRFFQSKFVTALTDWSIRAEADLEFMKEMKDAREDFEGKINRGEITHEQIEKYCREECHDLARLVRELIEAHKNVDLELKSYFGAGSTAMAFLKRSGVAEHLAPPPEGMRRAVMCGFFGGRFEISRVGPVETPVYNYDISSAYPYQTTLLPCLVCGRWELAKGQGLRRAIEKADLALVRTRVRKSREAPDGWGPLPFRTEKGTIVFPRSLGSVWVWKEEFLMAERLYPGTEPYEAWIYRTDCDHRPFHEVPEVYVERLRIGKEARGIVLKLGLNSVYGKLAQAIGRAPFQSYVWAGVITSNTRAQLLQALSVAKNPWSILMFATDGVFSSERLTMPGPIDTGTGDVCERGSGKKKPLGGWEEKVFDKGVFFMRPGVYFPLQPTKEQLKEVKARGMSKAVLLKNVNNILAYWEKYGPNPIPETGKELQIAGLQRFVGMRTGVQSRGKAKRLARSEDYGDWIPYPVEVSMTPLPKRKRVLPDHRLETFDYMAGSSAMYSKNKVCPETQAFRDAEEVMHEQADGDFSEASYE